jgi:PII-like signaling protein
MGLIRGLLGYHKRRLDLQALRRMSHQIPVIVNQLEPIKRVYQLLKGMILGGRAE